MQKSKTIIIIQAIVFSLGLMVFSYFTQYDRPMQFIAFVALLVSAYIISKNIRTIEDLSRIFGEKIPTRKILILVFIGIIVGIIIAIPYRDYHHWGTFPASVKKFAFIAALIGGTEELVFRGFLQEFVKKINGPFSILFSTLSHTGYKCLLFLSPGIAENTPIGFLFFWTFGVGLVFGISRHYTKSLWLPITAHIIFDVLSYAEFAQSPWWVW